MEPAAPPELSVVVATYNRGPSLARLLGQLARQELPPGRFEVVVVDDGSRTPAREVLAGLALPYRLTLLEQPNAGAAAARHRGVLAARAPLLLVTDDDMQVGPEFLAAHLAAHPPGTRRAILGRMRPPADAGRLPLFERFHAGTIEDQVERPRGALRPARGTGLYTGNVSLRREDYLAVGGFDPALRQAEDTELGVRLELAGVEILFSEEAVSVHESDHADFAAWRRRARDYGRHYLRIARKHPGVPHADPWYLLFHNAAAKRPVVAAALVWPPLGRLLCGAVHGTALLLERLGLERAALAGTSLLFDLEFFLGVRAEAGGLRPALRTCLAYLDKARAAGALPGAGRGGRALAALLRPLTR